MRRLFAAFAFAIASFAPCARAQDPSARHLEAARELLAEMGMETVLDEAVDVALDAQLQTSPQLEPFADVLRTFMTKYMSWQALEAPLTRIYADAYTETELEELTAFYRTETGRKTARLTPVLMARSMEMGRQAVEDHMSELEYLILQRAEELEEASGGSY